MSPRPRRISLRSLAWMGKALCRHADGDIWFPDPAAQVRDAKSIEVAKAICAACPVRDACLADAESRNDTRGIWGGVWFYVSKEGYTDDRRP